MRIHNSRVRGHAYKRRKKSKALVVHKQRKIGIGFHDDTVAHPPKKDNPNFADYLADTLGLPRTDVGTAAASILTVKEEIRREKKSQNNTNKT